jgi:hypothetical protein
VDLDSDPDPDLDLDMDLDPGLDLDLDLNLDFDPDLDPDLDLDLDLDPESIHTLVTRSVVIATSAHRCHCPVLVPSLPPAVLSCRAVVNATFAAQWHLLIAARRDHPQSPPSLPSFAFTCNAPRTSHIELNNDVVPPESLPTLHVRVRLQRSHPLIDICNCAGSLDTTTKDAPHLTANRRCQPPLFRLIVESRGLGDGAPMLPVPRRENSTCSARTSCPTLSMPGRGPDAGSVILFYDAAKDRNGDTRRGPVERRRRT